VSALVTVGDIRRRLVVDGVCSAAAAPLVRFAARVVDGGAPAADACEGDDDEPTGRGGGGRGDPPTREIACPDSTTVLTLLTPRLAGPAPPRRAPASSSSSSAARSGAAALAEEAARDNELARRVVVTLVATLPAPPRAPRDEDAKAPRRPSPLPQPACDGAVVSEVRMYPRRRLSRRRDVRCMAGGRRGRRSSRRRRIERVRRARRGRRDAGLAAARGGGPRRTLRVPSMLASRACA
jgi:hypothetical protein